MNPVLAYHKEEKAKALKKSQRATTKLRTEKLSKRNASKLEQQIETLESAPALRPHEQKQLEELRRQFNAVLKAKKTLGIDAGGVGKRKRDEEVKKEDAAGEGKTDRERQKERREGLRGGKGGEAAAVKEGLLGEDTDSSDEEVEKIPMPPGPLPPLPGAPVPKTTYEAKPVMRDFIKEAAAFVPRNIVVQKKKEVVAKEEKGDEDEEDEEDEEGSDVGDEEMGEAEEEREYRERKMQEGTAGKATAPPPPTLGSMYRINAAPDVEIEEQVKRFEVEMEDVEDQGN